MKIEEEMVKTSDVCRVLYFGLSAVIPYSEELNGMLHVVPSKMISLLIENS